MMRKKLRELTFQQHIADLPSSATGKPERIRGFT